MSEERPEYAAALTTQVGGNHYKDMAYLACAAFGLYAGRDVFREA